MTSITHPEKGEPGGNTSISDRSPAVSISQTGEGSVVLHFSGDWIINQPLPPFEPLEKMLLSDPKQARIQFETSRVKNRASLFLTFLVKVISTASSLQIETFTDGLPPGVKRLMALASAVPEREGVPRGKTKESFLGWIGSRYLEGIQPFLNLLAFLGELFLAFSNLLRGRAQFRGRDLLWIIKRTGADALPIVSLISILVGLILAFVGAVQLRIFGAQIYVASLVAIAMLRVMGAIMTGIIMAGRTGSAFAAELGTMQVNEEIDALQTLGISPIEFLVLPRILGLSLMMPLLGIYSDFMGMLGGMIVGCSFWIFPQPSITTRP